MLTSIPFPSSYPVKLRWGRKKLPVTRPVIRHGTASRDIAREDCVERVQYTYSTALYLPRPRRKQTRRPERGWIRATISSDEVTSWYFQGEARRGEGDEIDEDKEIDKEKGEQ